jgi:eukaryotic-like serine/threonine-protein kinase
MTQPQASFEPSVFSPGEVLAGRYRIVRFIAHGVLGTVYEAEDLTLGEPVALKTLRPELVQDEQTAQRFKREIRLARKVTHPNICRLFGFFPHQKILRPGGGASGELDITFLTMELLRGETLAGRLRRSGPLTGAEALPIVEQLAGALDAAHAAGVVHRDFKSDNIMLVPHEPSGAGPGPAVLPAGVRAVITDFGLASAAIISGKGLPAARAEIVGTPAYMSPEQVQGGPITAAADVYALGIVLYEMVTGVLPFVGETALATARLRLTEPPPSPLVYAPGLASVWEEAILRCLELDPAERFASAAQVPRALSASATGGAAAATTRGTRPVKGHTWRRAAALAAGLLTAFGAGLLMFAAVGLVMRPSVHEDAGPAEPALQAGVAVLGLQNLSGRPEIEWLSVALSEMLATELSSDGRFRMISRHELAALRDELDASRTREPAAEVLARIRGQLGAELVLLGSYVALDGEAGGQVRIDVRLQETRSGKTLGSVSDSGPTAELFELVSRTGARLRQALSERRAAGARP